MTPARAREAVKAAMDGYDWNGKRRLSTAVLGDLCAKLLARAVARERAAWRREVKKLKDEKGDPEPYTHDCAVYMQALDDLLQRRAQKGGRP